MKILMEAMIEYSNALQDMCSHVVQMWILMRIWRSLIPVLQGIG